MGNLIPVNILAGTLFIVSCAGHTKTPFYDKQQQVILDEFLSLADRDFQTNSDSTEPIILAQRTRVNSPHLDGHWFYTQLNTGEDKKLYRQRLSQISLAENGMEIVQKTYGLNTPENYVDAWDNLDLLANMTQDDFASYFNAGCEQIWSRVGEGIWSGKVDPESCVIDSKRRSRKIRIGSVSYLSKESYKTSETGYEMNMSYIWGSKPGELISLFPHEISRD